MEFKKFVVTVPNFPKEGIMFRDITPILADPEGFKAATEAFVEYAKARGANFIVGPEARGFIFGIPVAYELGAGFAPVRKPGKLPREVVSASYSLEYGTGTLCMHKDAIKKGAKVVIIDDLLATGGTMEACAKLVEALGAEVVGMACCIELTDLKGRQLLNKYDVFSLMQYEGE